MGGECDHCGESELCDKEFQEIFESFDTNNSGTIDKAEMKIFIKKLQDALDEQYIISKRRE